MKNTIKKYLDSYADLRALAVLDKVQQKRFILVIPAFNEGEDFLENLSTFQSYGHHALVIVVVNEPHDAREDEIRANKKLLKWLQEIDDASRKNDCSIIPLGSYVLPRAKGVGLARKIGADAALCLINQGIIKEPIIFSTDADAELPRDYFERAMQSWSKNTAAFVYPFIHEQPADERQAIAIELYEKRLNNYVEGLKFAASPYAFHTIGSTLALSAVHYAQARGFPPIAAGEDFYVLNKLKKLGDIISLKGDPIRLSARLSDRVAFGTGPALAKIVRDDPKNALLFYDKQVFLILKEFLASIQKSIVDENNDFIVSLPPLARASFLSLHPSELEANIKMRKSTRDRLKAFHDYFDALKTLKFIHYLRDHHFPNRNFYNDTGTFIL